MASCGPPVAAARKQLRVLLPFSRSSLRIPDELAAEIGATEARIRSGGKVWPVEVGRDGDGAFLGRGWRPFADACGVGGGWVLVLRHRGGGVLTVKAFDDTACIRELGAPTTPSAEKTWNSKGAIRKPQFIRVLSKDFMEKMLIPAKFVQRYFPKEHLSSCMATVLGPRGKVCSIELEMDQLDLFFAGGWPQFVALNGVREGDSLLLRYESNVAFSVKLFGPDGCRRECELRVQQTSTFPETGKQQEAPSASIWKHMGRNKASSRKNYKIGPRSWIRKQINADTLERHLALATAFSNAIGLREPCTITLKTSMDSTESWPVHGFPWKKRSFLIVQGWRRFCQENSLKEGDFCIFNVIKTTLWHVIIKRCKEQQETPPASKYDCSDNEGRKRPKGSTTVLNKASSKKNGVFDIGPPAWIEKEMSTNAIENRLYLSQVFCEAIGIREACTITLKTSMSSTRSWQARVLPYDYCSHHVVGPGWTSFCRENRIKVGDVCTFNIVEPTLWEVVIRPRIS